MTTVTHHNYLLLNHLNVITRFNFYYFYGGQFIALYSLCLNKFQLILQKRRKSNGKKLKFVFFCEGKKYSIFDWLTSAKSKCITLTLAQWPSTFYILYKYIHCSNSANVRSVMCTFNLYYYFSFIMVHSRSSHASKKKASAHTQHETFSYFSWFRKLHSITRGIFVCKSISESRDKNVD